MTAVEPIKLTDAARYYSLSPHQTEAWDWLQGEIDQKTLDKFAVRYRHPKEPTKPPAPTEGYITADLMQAITGHPASSFDQAFVNLSLIHI